MQGSFVGPARITSSAIPIPARSKSQAGRTNFSRPHDTLTSKDADYAQQQTEEHLSATIGSQLPYAEASPQQEQGHSHPARQPHDSVYSAYTETSEFGTPRAAPQAPFQPAIRPEYSPSSSSRTVQTIHENNGTQRSELQSFDSYQRSYHEPPATHAPPTSSSNAKRHRRTPSQVLASAIAKHRAQRAAAGLTTEGQYYVDPKTKKYYFVADSGQAGGSALSKSKEGKESDKSKERRKLHKKEAGWEITKVKSPQSATPPHTPQQEYQRDRSFSISNRSKGSSRGSEEGHGSASKWKIWSSNRGHGSRDNTPQASPLQPSPMNRDPNTSQGHLYSDQNGQETLAISNSPGNGPHVAQQPGSHFPGAPTYPQASPRIVQVPPDNYVGRSPSSSPENRLNSRGMASSSSQGYGSYPTPHLQPPPNFGYPVDEHGHPGHAMQRSNSVYSNYSYYEMPSDQGYISSSRASPVMERSHSSSRGHGSSTNTPVPMSSPYMAPNGPEFQPTSGSHSRQPSTTLDKAKSSMHRSGSLQLLAPSKHQNLTVPKGDSAHGLDFAELARTNPNDPLVCLHLGIDAHERGDLEESAQLFEKSANGGCSLGMLMFGLSLRHGWVSRNIKVWSNLQGLTGCNLPGL